MSERTIGVTGASGFIGQSLCRRLSEDGSLRVLECPRDAWNDREALAAFVRQCDFVFHLAGKNRGDDDEVRHVNQWLMEQLLAAASQLPRPPHIVFASSTQRERSNAYGSVKRWCEEQLTDWTGSAEGRTATTLVIPNVYGPLCKPHYNSVVATFCHQLARGETPAILDDALVNFVWINDLVDQISHLLKRESRGYTIEHIRSTGVLCISELLAKLRKFHVTRQAGVIPDLTDRFDASLHATLESHFDLSQHCWQPRVYDDQRGRLFEILKLAGGGQVFFSTTRPGIVRGNHFHTRKLEWFCVLQGDAVIRLRRIGGGEIHEFRVSGQAPQFISIPVWHAHQIENVGDVDLLTMFWSSEIFDPADADTYFENVA